MRLIDADALLERLEKTDRYFAVKHDIDSTPTALEWIDASEELPSDSRDVLVSDGETIVNAFGFYNSAKRHWYLWDDRISEVEGIRRWLDISTLTEGLNDVE